MARTQDMQSMGPSSGPVLRTWLYDSLMRKVLACGIQICFRWLLSWAALLRYRAEEVIVPYSSLNGGHRQLYQGHKTVTVLVGITVSLSRSRRRFCDIVLLPLGRDGVMIEQVDCVWGQLLGCWESFDFFFVCPCKNVSCLSRQPTRSSGQKWEVLAPVKKNMLIGSGLHKELPA